MCRQTITVQVDRPIGSLHPKHPDIRYTLNYGYCSGVFAGDGEEQDVYIYGVLDPVEQFTGQIVAVIHRLNDVEDKWVAAPFGVFPSREQIKQATWFVEQDFQSEIQVIERKREDGTEV